MAHLVKRNSLIIKRNSLIIKRNSLIKKLELDNECYILMVKRNSLLPAVLEIRFQTRAWTPRRECKTWPERVVTDHSQPGKRLFVKTLDNMR